jgi:signal transduction histidine kinase
VRVLAEAQGGRIACAGAPGGGAAFTLTLQATA